MFTQIAAGKSYTPSRHHFVGCRYQQDLQGTPTALCKLHRCGFSDINVDKPNGGIYLCIRQPCLKWQPNQETAQF